MKDNRTGLICDSCNSHIIAYRHEGKLIFECSYCGERPEDILPIDFIEVEDE
jgi:predicted RNA-binding Zn-ribbon protein involved in translation (DUF1610 family)